MNGPLARLATIEHTVTGALSKGAIPLLRTSLGITYIWFGGLKLVGRSPVAALVARTIPLLPNNVAVKLMGLWEVAIGIGLFFRVAIRPTLLLFFLQSISTFLTFLLRPQDTFQQGNPLLLKKDGEFIIKNLVLLSAGLAVASKADSEDESAS